MQIRANAIAELYWIAGSSAVSPARIVKNTRKADSRECESNLRGAVKFARENLNGFHHTMQLSRRADRGGAIERAMTWKRHMDLLRLFLNLEASGLRARECSGFVSAPSNDLQMQNAIAHSIAQSSRYCSRSYPKKRKQSNSRGCQSDRAPAVPNSSMQLGASLPGSAPALLGTLLAFNRTISCTLYCEENGSPRSINLSRGNANLR